MERLLDKNEFHKVIGEIYKITNLLTNKCYIGQTRSHRLNHNKYRPFGYMGRFKDHISESTNPNKIGCKYLNSALLKYGVNNFQCELIITCNVDELDFYEVKYIVDLNTKYPNGYNLTNGGQSHGYLKGKKIIFAVTYRGHHMTQPAYKEIWEKTVNKPKEDFLRDYLE